MTNELLSARIRNWLADLAIGAKAVSMELDLEQEPSSGDKASCYSDVLIDGIVTVPVHNIKQLAEVAELELKHRDFVEGDYYWEPFTGEDFVMFNGVKFTDFILRKENKDEGK